MARRKKPEVTCYHCDRDLQYELEAMRGALQRTISQCHTYEKSNIKLEEELDKVRNLVREAYYEGFSEPSGKPEWEFCDAHLALGAAYKIDAPDDRYDKKPEEEE